ncbi:MAG TPA: 2-amino-4-hydroxy-6-hydroxymethyldihydropteridine diphosphokinase [Micromonosporaceae bacterium]|jgi:2-amino-4-hydroxy-6-hydroxymethyldihydropteridine diphosphokinase
MTRALLSLGSNLGDRYEHLRTAIRALEDVLVLVSGVYETPPWGDTDQPNYLNAAALVAGSGVAADWLARAQDLEDKANRVRDPERRFGPRTLDVDVIMVWSDDGLPVISTDPELTLPHPRAHLRAFVLRPWLDIQPYAQVPGFGWLTDLMRTDPVAADLPALVPRADLVLEPESTT